MDAQTGAHDKLHMPPNLEYYTGHKQWWSNLHAARNNQLNRHHIAVSPAPNFVHIAQIAGVYTGQFRIYKTGNHFKYSFLTLIMHLWRDDFATSWAAKLDSIFLSKSSTTALSKDLSFGVNSAG